VAEGDKQALFDGTASDRKSEVGKLRQQLQDAKLAAIVTERELEEAMEQLAEARCISKHTCKHACKSTCNHNCTYAHTHTPTHPHTHTPTLTLTLTLTLTFTLLHTYIHTYIHTYTRNQYFAAQNLSPEPCAQDEGEGVDQRRGGEGEGACRCQQGVEPANGGAQGGPQQCRRDGL
jgi:hypothetical protein